MIENNNQLLWHTSEYLYQEPTANICYCYYVYSTVAAYYYLVDSVSKVNFGL